MDVISEQAAEMTVSRHERANARNDGATLEGLDDAGRACTRGGELPCRVEGVYTGCFRALREFAA